MRLFPWLQAALCCSVAPGALAFGLHAKRSLTPKRGAALAAPRMLGAATQTSEPLKAEEVKQESAGVGVLLLNLGGPERSEDVEPFLYNLFADPDIIRLPSGISWLQGPLAYLVSKRRAPKSRAAYDSIGGGSPLGYWTRQQALALEDELAAQLDKADPPIRKLLEARPAKCYIAMRYWKPFTEEALEQIAADRISQLVILPLYPQFSVSTSGSSLRALQKIFYSDPETWGPPALQHTVVPYWYQRAGYLSSVRRIVQTEIDAYTEEQRKEGVHVLFSAHGVPKSYVDAGDPYEAQIEKCVELIAKGFPDDVRVHLSYQSRVGPIEWLRPYTDDKLRELGAQGVKNLVAVPISFVSEHIETLEEMDMEYREVAEEAGIHGWRRAPALNTDAEFVSDMAAAVLEALNAPAVSIAEACAANNVELVEKPLQERSRGKSRRLNDDDDPSPPGFPDEKLYTQQTPWTNTGKNSKIDSGRLKNRRKCVDDRNNDEGPVFARIWKPEILYARLSEAGILGGILLEVLQSKGTMHCVFGL